MQLSASDSVCLALCVVDRCELGRHMLQQASAASVMSKFSSDIEKEIKLLAEPLTTEGTMLAAWEGLLAKATVLAKERPTHWSRELTVAFLGAPVPLSIRSPVDELYYRWFAKVKMGSRGGGPNCFPELSIFHHLCP